MSIIKFEKETLRLRLELTNEGDCWACSCTRALIGAQVHNNLGTCTRHEERDEAFRLECSTLLSFIKSQPRKPKKADMDAFIKWMNVADIDTEIDLAMDIARATGAEIELPAVDDAAPTHEDEALPALPAGMQDRQALMVEAFAFLGEIKGVSLMTKIGDDLQLRMLDEVKKSKIYKEMQGIGTWAKYCEALGFSARYIDERLAERETFGERFLEMISSFGIPHIDRRTIRAEVQDGAIVITDACVIIDVAEDITEADTPKKLEIPYENKEELQSVLADVIEKKNKEKKAAKEALKDAEHTIKTMDKEKTALTKENRKLEEQLAAFTDGGEIGGVPVDDIPIYNKLSSATESATELFAHLNSIVKEQDSLSEANLHYLGSVLFHLNDLSVRLCKDARTNPITFAQLFGNAAVTPENIKLPVGGLKLV